MKRRARGETFATKPGTNILTTRYAHKIFFITGIDFGWQLGIGSHGQRQALDEVREAVNLAQNFSDCGTDTQNLQMAWERAMRSEERAKEALLEAWSATVTSADHIGTVLNERLFHRLVNENFDFMKYKMKIEEVSEETCQNMTLLAQRLYGKAFELLDEAVQPLVEKLATFRVLAAFQERWRGEGALEVVNNESVFEVFLKFWWHSKTSKNHPKQERFIYTVFFSGFNQTHCFWSFDYITDDTDAK